MPTNMMRSVRIGFDVMVVGPPVFALLDTLYRIKFGVVPTFGYRLAKRIYDYRRPNAHFEPMDMGVYK